MSQNYNINPSTFLDGVSRASAYFGRKFFPMTVILSELYSSSSSRRSLQAFLIKVSTKTRSSYHNICKRSPCSKYQLINTFTFKDQANTIYCKWALLEHTKSPKIGTEDHHPLLVVSPNIVKSTAIFHRQFYFLSMSVRLSSARYFSLHMSPGVPRPASSPPLCHRTTASTSAALGQCWVNSGQYPTQQDIVTRQYYFQNYNVQLTQNSF